MACTNCTEQNSVKGYVNMSALEYYPLNATDMEVYDGNEIRKLEKSDWINGRHKLLLFYPSTFTPVCSSEMGALDNWIPEFDEQNCDVFSVTTDDIKSVEEWYKQEFNPTKHKAISSYLLATRLGLLNGSKSKRASVFITNKGDIVRQEHFMNVGRSLKELHRMIYAYNQDSYCAADWTDPSDGFLQK